MPKSLDKKRTQLSTIRFGDGKSAGTEVCQRDIDIVHVVQRTVEVNAAVLILLNQLSISLSQEPRYQRD